MYSSASTLYHIRVFVLLTTVIYFRSILLYKHWKASRAVLLRRVVPLVNNLGSATYCLACIIVIIAVFRRSPGPRLSHLDGQLMELLPLNFGIWCLTSSAAHTLPVVDLQTGSSPHRSSRLERVMQTAPLRAAVAFIIPSIAVATQVVAIQSAYHKQLRLRETYGTRWSQF